jgi:hypothetical protein
MELQLAISGWHFAMSAAGGETIERRIRISRRADEKGKCKGSRVWDPRKDFCQCMQPSTTRLTSNAISFQQEHTGLFERRPQTRGARPLPQREHVVNEIVRVHRSTT